MLLVVDNGSIYTSNLIDFLKGKNFLFDVHAPESLDLNSLQNYDSIILSGRRKNDKKTNEINSKVVNYSIKNDVKLLGICYGAEILALTLGGTIRKNSVLQKGNEIIKTVKDNPISNNSLEVFESHRFEIAKLPNTLVHVAESTHCKYEIIQYKQKLIFGTQFHPEMSIDGQSMLEKFFLL